MFVCGKRFCLCICVFVYRIEIKSNTSPIQMKPLACMHNHRPTNIQIYKYTNTHTHTESELWLRIAHEDIIHSSPSISTYECVSYDCMRVNNNYSRILLLYRVKPNILSRIRKIMTNVIEITMKYSRSINEYLKFVHSFSLNINWLGKNQNGQMDFSTNVASCIAIVTPCHFSHCVLFHPVYHF